MFAKNALKNLKRDETVKFLNAEILPNILKVYHKITQINNNFYQYKQQKIKSENSGYVTAIYLIGNKTYNCKK